MQKRLLLFDIDGTLIHSGGARVEALKCALTERFGIKDNLHDIEIAGMTDSGIVISILNKHKIPTTADNIAAFLDSYVHFLSRELPRRKGKLLPGVLELLEKLKTRKHLVLGLLTGNVSRGAQLKLGHYGVWHFFEFGAFADDHHDRNELGAFARARAKEQPHVLPLEGEIDLHVSPEVAELLRTMIAKKPKVVVVDLTKVTYFDSSGLAVLIEGMQNVQEYGGMFALAGVQESVQNIFDIARLDQVFQIFPDVDSALAAK